MDGGTVRTLAKTRSSPLRATHRGFAGVAVLHDTFRADLFRREAFVRIGRVHDNLPADRRFRFDARRARYRETAARLGRLAAVDAQALGLVNLQRRAPRYSTRERRRSYAVRIQSSCASSGAAPRPIKNHKRFVGRPLPP